MAVGIRGTLVIPAAVTGMPMSYSYEGVQYVVFAVGSVLPFLLWGAPGIQFRNPRKKVGGKMGPTFNRGQ